MCPESVNNGAHSSSSWMKGLSVALSSAARYASASSLVRWIETVIVSLVELCSLQNEIRNKSTHCVPLCQLVVRSPCSIHGHLRSFSPSWVARGDLLPTSLIIMPRMPLTCFSLHYETKRSSLITVLLPLVILFVLCYLFLLTSLYIFDLVT